MEACAGDAPERLVNIVLSILPLAAGAMIALSFGSKEYCHCQEDDDHHLGFF